MCRGHPHLSTFLESLRICAQASGLTSSRPPVQQHRGQPELQGRGGAEEEPVEPHHRATEADVTSPGPPTCTGARQVRGNEVKETRWIRRAEARNT